MNTADKIVLYDFAGEDSLSEDFRNKLSERAKRFEVIETWTDYSGDLSKTDIEDTDILVSRIFDKYTLEMFEDTDLEYIGVMATDKSHYPLEELDSEGITVKNAPKYALESVAELTINMMLHLSLRNYKTTNFVESGDWNVGPFPGKELKNRKLGIIGLGSIGTRVAEIAETLGMNISYNSRQPKEFAEDRNWKYVDLEKLVSESDVISIHCSLNESTENLLDTELLENISENTIILNAAREEIQDVGRTIELCEQGKILAWFDAMENEDDRKRILDTGNAVLTSHSGCATDQAKQRLKQKTLENLDEYLQQE